MIGRTSIRWHLVAWVTAVLIAAAAVIFAVVYERTGDELRAQIEHDVGGDVTQLSQAVRSMPGPRASDLLTQIHSYLAAQPYSATSTLLFAVIPGHGTVSNHPELLGSARPDDGETVAEQARENAAARTILTGATGLTTRRVPDVGTFQFDERILTVDHLPVRVGVGEPLITVVQAQRSIARSFLIAGALALVLALIASYLAGASLSRPVRRLAQVAARVGEGDLEPRMHPTGLAGSEVRVLADSFNHMLDRLAAAFAAQRDFIADASHELRTPLTVIAGQLEVLAAQERPAPDEVRRVERLVSAEIARTSRLVDDMLLLARSERRDFLRCQEVSLEPFVSELWLGASISDERHFELGPIPAATLTADPDRLAQALRNLIRNAVEQTSEPDGLVRLDVEARPEGRVRFVVTDDGPGIEPDQVESIFERFHRTDSARDRKAGGAGLGLAIVLAIAEAHDGTVRAVPRPGRGARFELELPGRHDVATSPSPSPSPSPASRPEPAARAAGPGGRV